MQYQPLKLPRGTIGRVHLEEFSNPVWRRQIARHAHRFIEAHLVARGNAVLVVGDQRVDLPSGSLLWLPPGVEHLTLEASASLRRWILSVRISAVRRLLSREEAALLLAGREQVKCVQLSRSMLDSLARLMEEVASQWNAGESYLNAAVGYALTRGHQAYCQASPSGEPTALHPAVARALSLMSGDGLLLSRDQLAAQCSTSATHLSRLFVQELGQPLREVRNRKRLARFQQVMLAGECDSLTEAALEAGFGSYSQFHRVFRQLTGRSPSDWNR